MYRSDSSHPKSMFVLLTHSFFPFKLALDIFCSGNVVENCQQGPGVVSEQSWHCN